MTLDLKSPQGLAAFMRMVEKADVVVENFRPDVKDRLGIDYDILREGQQAHRPRQHLRLRPGRPLSRPAGLRPDRAGHGRADVDHRPAGPGPGARRHPGRRSLRRPVLRARHHDRAARARSVRRGPVGHHLAAAGADLHARLPGRALAAGDEVAKQAGNNHPTSIPTGVFKTKDGHINIAATGHVMWERLCQAIGAPGLDRRIRTSRPARCARRTATRSMPRSRPRPSSKTERGMDRDLQQGRRALRADLFDRPGVRRPAGQAPQASRKTPRGPMARSRPSSASRSRCRARRARSSRRRRSSASTPTRCSRNSVSPTTKSPSCTRPRRYEALTEQRSYGRMTQTDKMLSRKEGGVGYLTFNNPERHNAVSLEMWEAAAGHSRRLRSRQGRSASWC